MKATADPRPLVVHVLYRFDTGGLENGVVNLVNRMTDWRHVVVSLTDVSPHFCRRVTNPEVRFLELNKPDGHGTKVWSALARHLRTLQPAVVHTRNLAALEMQPAAWWAGAPVRVHSEHGRDASDIDGTVKRYQWLRRAYGQFVHRWIALSRDLNDYLVQSVGVPGERVTQICNGVDDRRFCPGKCRVPVADGPFADASLCVVGTVGRMQSVKAQTLLAKAFVQALQIRPALRTRLRLVMVGEGALRAECQKILADAGVADLTWLPGERTDVPDVMRSLDLFVLPSLAEGISNTILEAMATALPVVATDVGGNIDLIDAGVSGQIVRAGDVPALASAIVDWCGNPERCMQAGRAGRQLVVQKFGLDAMVQAYRSVYEAGLLRGSRKSTS